MDAPELGVEDDIELAGGLLMGVGCKVFTEDAQRCGALTSEPGELGCFLFSVPRDVSTIWTSSGKLKLSQVASIANELGGAEPSSPERQLALAIQLQRRLSYGAEPYVRPRYTHRIATTQGIDCSDLGGGMRLRPSASSR